MHLYVIAAGHKDKMERWLNDLTAQYLPYEYEEGRVGQLQLMVRPVQLLEIIYPEKLHEEILKIMAPWRTWEDSRGLGKLSWLLRKALRLKPLKINAKNYNQYQNYKVMGEGIRCIAIGTRRDKEIEKVERL